jgi:hypothetical protein
MLGVEAIARINSGWRMNEWNGTERNTMMRGYHVGGKGRRSTMHSWQCTCGIKALRGESEGGLTGTECNEKENEASSLSSSFFIEYSGAR